MAVRGGVPFAPGADQSGLEKYDHVIVRGEDRLELNQVLLHLNERGVKAGAGVLECRDDGLYAESAPITRRWL